MNDVEYAVQRDRVRGYIQKWAKPMGILWWDIDHVWMRVETEKNKALASTNADWRYMHGTIKWFLPTVAEVGDEELETAVIHEFCHILVNEMDPEAGYTDHEERVCTMLAVGFRGVWKYAQQAVEQDEGELT